MTKITARNAIACEYVAQGAFGKYNIVNVYSSDIVVHEFPAAFPVAFYAELVAAGGLPEELHVYLYNNDHLVAELTVNYDLGTDELALLALPQIPLQFIAESQIRLVLKTPDEEETTILTKRILLGQIPGMSPPVR